MRSSWSRFTLYTMNLITATVSYNQDLVDIITMNVCEGVTPACIKQHAIITMIVQIQ